MTARRSAYSEVALSVSKCLDAIEEKIPASVESAYLRGVLSGLFSQLHDDDAALIVMKDYPQ